MQKLAMGRAGLDFGSKQMQILAQIKGWVRQVDRQ
jgi:hypothetical protein